MEKKDEKMTASRTISNCWNADTSVIEGFIEKQNKRIQQLKEKLLKVSRAQEREHIKIVYRSNDEQKKGEAAMRNLEPRYKFKMYCYKKKSRTKIADRKAVKRRAEFKKIVNEEFELLYECMLKALTDMEVK